MNCTCLRTVNYMQNKSKSSESNGVLWIVENRGGETVGVEARRVSKSFLIHDK